jgi:glycosyltransferase involved in cell wall biosynthesis
MGKRIVLIPAYKPEDKMLRLLESLREYQDAENENDREIDGVVVVDDGGQESFRALFEAAEAMGCRVVHHRENRGKGAAIRTGLQAAMEFFGPDLHVVTADADGQHRYEDILRVCETARAHPEALVLGSRMFEGEVPLRSRLGNGITRHVFSIASGAKVYDTQTGLRAFGPQAMRRFIDVPGDRYEYEINMLLTAAQSGMPILEEKIETVYLNDNASSHFNPFKDSIKIYLCILKFSASSLLAFVIDYVLALLLKGLTAAWPAALSLNFSVIAARVVSGTVNFTVNRRVVFKGNESLGKAVAKYAAVACVVLCLNLALMHGLTALGVPFALAKILVETTLFFFNFTAQGKFVFRKKS